jgi:hypothetical protein
MRFDLEELAQTLKGKNSLFLSDHITRNTHKLASTETIKNLDPFKNKMESFNLVRILRRHDSSVKNPDKLRNLTGSNKTAPKPVLVTDGDFDFQDVNEDYD